MSLKMKKYNQIQNRTYELLARGSVKDFPSLIVDIFLFILILLNVTAVCLESVKHIGNEAATTFAQRLHHRARGVTSIGHHVKHI